MERAPVHLAAQIEANPGLIGGCRLFHVFLFIFCPCDSCEGEEAGECVVA
jgi:hypothetical protein